jgi:hypothetical protein
MLATGHILPGTGRGTMRSMVEGHMPDHLTSRGRMMPRVPLHPAAARRGPPPRAGEEL